MVVVAGVVARSVVAGIVVACTVVASAMVVAIVAAAVVMRSGVVVAGGRLQIRGGCRGCISGGGCARRDHCWRRRGATRPRLLLLLMVEDASNCKGVDIAKFIVVLVGRGG